MTDFVIKKLPCDLSSHAGLAFVGKNLKRVNVNALIDPIFPVRSGVANSEILKSYLALVCLGKSDFDAIEGFRNNACFKRALGLGVVPSSPTLRQRMDTHAASWFDRAPQMNQLLLSSRINGQPMDFVSLACGYTGVQHSASESEYNLERALPMAASLVSTPLLVRADSGFCSAKLMQEITAQAQTLQREIAFIIKWNPRKSPVKTIAEKRVADASTPWVSERLGKRECLWQEALEVTGVASASNPARRVYHLTERTIDKHGNTLLLPTR